ncbi:hypothetical protein D3C84_941780 [compost metagenome]
MAGAVLVANQLRLPIQGFQTAALDHHQGHQPLFFHRVATAMGVEAGVASLMQVLAVIGGVDQQRVVQVGLGEHPREKFPDVPQQGVFVGIAIQHPVIGLTVETIALAGFGHLDELPARQCRAVGHERVRVFIVHRKVRADLVKHH